MRREKQRLQREIDSLLGEIAQEKLDAEVEWCMLLTEEDEWQAKKAREKRELELQEGISSW